MAGDGNLLREPGPTMSSWLTAKSFHPPDGVYMSAPRSKGVYSQETVNKKMRKKRQNDRRGTETEEVDGGREGESEREEGRERERESERKGKRERESEKEREGDREKEGKSERESEGER